MIITDRIVSQLSFAIGICPPVSPRPGSRPGPHHPRLTPGLYLSIAVAQPTHPPTHPPGELMNRICAARAYSFPPLASHPLLPYYITLDFCRTGTAARRAASRIFSSTLSCQDTRERAIYIYVVHSRCEIILIYIYIYILICIDNIDNLRE